MFNDSSRLIDQLRRECEFARDDLKRVASALVESEKMDKMKGGVLFSEAAPR